MQLPNMEEEGADQLSKLLKKRGLCDAKWSHFFSKEGITNISQVLERKGTVRDMSTALISLANEDEKESVKQLFGIKFDEMPGGQDWDIENKLNGAGLEAKYWLPVFSKQLGVTSLFALECAGLDSLSNLERFVRSVSDIEGLCQLFNVKIDEICFEAQRKQINDKLALRLQNANQSLQKLQSLQLSVTDYSEKEILQCHDNIRQMLQISPLSWKPCKTSEQFTGQLQKQFESINTKLERKDMPGSLLLQKASCGLALQGVMLGKTFSDQLKDRGNMLRCPQNIQLLSPVHSCSERISQFNNKNEESLFRQTVDRLGYSAMACIQMSEICPKVPEQAKDTAAKVNPTTLKYVTIPLASYIFSDDDCQLSKEALQQLQEIENLLGDEQSSNIEQMCEDFFEKFGSHAFKGPLTFGGICWCRWHTKGNEYDPGDDAVEDNIEVSEKTSISSRMCEVLRTGEPENISKFHEWRIGLITSNTTWMVIDRGTYLVPVWEIIDMNHKEQFKSTSKLSHILHFAWKKMVADSEAPMQHLIVTSGDPICREKDYQVPKKEYDLTDVLAKYTEDSVQSMNVYEAQAGPVTFVPTHLRIAATVGLAKKVQLACHESKHNSESILITTIMYPFQHPAAADVVKLLYLHDLEYLSEYLRKHRLALSTINGKYLSRLGEQIYLFNLAIEIYHNKFRWKVSEKQALKQIDFIRKKLGDQLDPAIEHVLSIPSCDLKTIELGLRDLSKKLLLFEKLHLDEHYIQKLGLKDALFIREETLEGKKCTELKQLPFFVLQKIMAYDYRCRTNLQYIHSQNYSENFDIDDDDYESEDSMNGDERLPIVHPMDSLLALLCCADDFLYQDLLARLSSCQLAIPLLLPDPFTSQITYSIWALRSIVKEWQCINGDKMLEQEHSIVNCKVPIISFLRLGKNEKSKSHIINEVIGDSHHVFNHFFHRDCEGGHSKQLLGKGVVEVYWYLPSGKENDAFPSVVTFLNLHGDAQNYPKQTSFISEASFMSFIIVTEESVSVNNSDMIEKLASMPGGTVLLLCSKEGEKIRELKQKLGDKLQHIRVVNRNAHQVKNNIRHKLNKMLRDKWSCMEKTMKTLVECEDIAKCNGFCIDESKLELKEGKKMAEIIPKLISETSSSTKCAEGSLKEQLLPLQGKYYWHKWAKLDKEEHQQIHRGEETIGNYASRILVDKMRIRNKQLSEVDKATGVMTSFLAGVHPNIGETPGLVRRYFLQWLKLGLNELSRDELTQLRSKYNHSKLQLCALQDSPVPSDSLAEHERKINQCKEEIEHLHERLINASFGIEHLLREAGQIYEAVEKSPNKKDLEQYSHLPGVAADILIDGDHIELMDGDTAHVPITWINAVLQELKRKLDDPRMFILSVLGLQSSGKSTLMNSTFGAQFSVSAGRCTRGAFIQLLPVHDSLKTKVNCDYVLIVDTEGLRAPSVTIQQQHDNELATFVIGLANATMINIYGETSGDMDDILQTVVHAFLRMKHVHLDLSCQFVHQNVSSIMATSKGGIDRYKFKQKLDELTCLAAKAENCEGLYKYFSDLIKYDDKTDVHYFPTLWRGDPPMAPINHGYSEKAQSLKNRIVRLMGSIGNSQPVTAFQIRIQDLWNAILHENFVFSFKNTLEILAYSSLDNEFNQWAWIFQQKMLEWEQTVQNIMYSADAENEETLSYERYKVDLQTLVEKTTTEIETKMEDFFETTKYRDILCKWKEETQHRLKTLKLELMTHAETHCQQLLLVREKYNKLRQQKNSYHEALLLRVKQLISKSGEKLDEDRLKHIFDEHWMKWREEIQAIPLPCMNEEDIERSVEETITKHFKTKASVLSRKLKEKKICEWGNSIMTIRSDVHFALSKHWIINQVQAMTQKKSTFAKEAVAITENALQRGHEYLNKIQNQKFNTKYTLELLHEVLDPISSDNIVFRSEYKVELSLIICGRAVKKFQEMEISFWRQNSPIEFFEQDMYEHVFSLFKNQCLQIAQEKTAAEAFCKLLKKPIECQVIDSLSSEIVSDIIQNVQHFSTKSALKAKILIDLAENFERSGNFDEYYLYLNDIQRSLQHWIKQYTKLHCESGEESKRIVVFASTKLSLLLNFVLSKVQEVTRKVQDEETQEGALDVLAKKRNCVKTWLEIFCRDDEVKGKLKLDFRAIQDIGEFEDSSSIDITNFSDEVDKVLKKLSDQILSLFMNMTVDSMDSWKLRPYDILYNRLHGCCEQCPFCKEQCEHPFEGHLSLHTVSIHRPQCLGGYRWVASSKMMTDICNALVASAHTFKKKRESDEKLKTYSGYKESYPDWYIQPSRKADTSKYWKWFLANHMESLAKAFNAKPATVIPNHWISMKWEDVKKELMDTYHL